MRIPLHRVFVLAALAAAAAARPPAVQAQAGRAELTGEVRDQAGAAVPDCRVTATERATGQVTATVTGRQGLFNLPYLRPGAYRVTAEAAGFPPTVRDAVVLATGDRVRVDLTL